MTYTDLIFNDFEFDYEDGIWYDSVYHYRASEVKYEIDNGSFKLYYGGYDIYLGEFSDINLFINKIKEHIIKSSRLKKLKKLQTIC